jgi:predicted metal-dependent enzyme (double-stranded beta helix superfamily)
MWAVIRVYQGLEHNELYVRAERGGLENVDHFTLAAGDVRTLDPSTIHSVQARGDRYLGAIHVYGGDLFGTPRSTWRGDVEYPMDESALPAFFDRLRRHETELGRAMTPDEVATFLAGPSAPT